MSGGYVCKNQNQQNLKSNYAVYGIHKYTQTFPLIIDLQRMIESVKVELIDKILLLTTFATTDNCSQKFWGLQPIALPFPTPALRNNVARIRSSAYLVNQ